MAVDIGDLIDPLKREVSAPGAEETTFPNADDDSWFGNLEDSFWEAKLDGLMAGYTEQDGLITPMDVNAADMPREQQQLIVYYAGVRIVRNHLRALPTVFRSKAGPVEYEVQHSATILKALLDELTKKRDQVLENLSSLGLVPSYYIDAILERDVYDSLWVSANVQPYATW